MAHGEAACRMESHGFHRSETQESEFHSPCCLLFLLCADYQGAPMPQHNGMMPPPHGMQYQTPMPTGAYHPGTPGTVQQPMVGRKRPNSAPGGSSLPRTRVEGRRCEVCAVIKKAGCGTDNAHFRCLKRKRPEGSQVCLITGARGRKENHQAAYTILS